MTVNYPSQFTGQAALSKQDPAAFKLDKWSYTPRKFTEDDVIIKIECCGICGSDLHSVTCGWRAHDDFPLIAGHEIVGTVVRAGANTTHKLGDRVGVGAQCGSCRECDNCNAGLEQYCTVSLQFTYQSPTGDDVQPYTQGGYADYFQGPGHFAVPIPDGISSEVAAPLLCAGVTVFSPLKAYGAGPGKKVGVIGIGGLGHLGLQFAAALGADVWAISHSERKRADALAMGAKGFIATGGSDAAVLKEHGNSFDMILCTSFQDGMPLQELYLPLLRPHGNMVVVGLPNEGVPRGGRALFGKSLTASLIGSVPDLYDMFEVAVKHGVKPWVETRPMSQASQAVQDMEDGKSKYRYVLVNEQ